MVETTTQRLQREQAQLLGRPVPRVVSPIQETIQQRQVDQLSAEGQEAINLITSEEARINASINKREQIIKELANIPKRTEGQFQRLRLQERDLAIERQQLTFLARVKQSTLVERGAGISGFVSRSLRAIQSRQETLQSISKRLQKAPDRPFQTTKRGRPLSDKDIIKIAEGELQQSIPLPERKQIIREFRSTGKIEVDPGGKLSTRPVSPIQEPTRQEEIKLQSIPPEFRNVFATNLQESVGVVSAAPQRGILGRISATQQQLERKQGVQAIPGAGISAILGVASVPIGLGQFAREFVINPAATIKNAPSGFATTKEFFTGGGFKRQLINQPGSVVGRIGGEIATFRVSQLAITKAPGIATKFTPKFKPAEKIATPLGIERVIKGLPGDIGDIGLIPPGGRPRIIKGQVTPPTIRGGFGFTQAEQRAFAKAEGTRVTSQRGFLPRFASKKTVDRGEQGLGLFVTPPEPITGRGLARVSRLGVNQPEASLLDILSGDVTFRRGRPQIIVFPKQEGQFRTGFASSELEQTIPPGKIIKKISKPGVTVIQGRRVPIIEAKIVSGSEEVRQILIKNSQGQKLTKLESTKLKRATGFSSREISNKPFISPTSTGFSGASLFVGTARSTLPSRVSQRLSAAVTTNPTLTQAFSLTSPISPAVSKFPITSPTITSPTTSLFISSPTPSTPVVSPPVTGIALLTPSLVPPPTPRQRKEQRKRLRRQPKSFNVFIKKDATKKGKRRFVKANKVPLSFVNARDLGSFVTDKTISSTFTLRGSSKKPKKPRTTFPPGNWFFNNQKFRTFQRRKGVKRPLRNTFIERRRFRLDSPGEVRKIQVERFLAQNRRGRTKKPKSQKIDFKKVRSLF